MSTFRRQPPRASTRDLPHPRAVPRGRQAIVTELMRLEHMRERAEKELAAWSDKERSARQRLDQINGRLDMLYDNVAQIHAQSRRLTLIEGGAGQPALPRQPEPPARVAAARRR